MLNKINLSITPDSSFLLGGVTVNTAFDRVTAVDKNDLPYLTATALKGAIRMEFDAFIGGIGEVKVCEPDADFRGCGTCISCRLFGGTKKEGKLRFNAAFLEKGEQILRKEIRQEIREKGKREGVSISRTLGKAGEGKYFSILTFPNLSGIADIVFNTAVDVRDGLADDEKTYLNAFFAFLKRTGIFIGSRKSAGLGHFQIAGTLPGEFIKPAPVDTSSRELKLFQLTLRALEPLVVGDLKNRYITNTLSYIPSSTMGGGIGYGMKQSGVDKTIISDVFLEKKTLSPFNFYLKSPFPDPASLRAKKGKEDLKQDILLVDYIIKTAIDKGSFPAVASLFNNLYRSQLRPAPICPPPKTTYNTKLAIDRELQKGKDQMLYSIELIAADTSFCGLMIGETWMAKALEGIELSIGGKKTRGFGLTKIEEVEEISVEKLLHWEVPIDTLLRDTAKEYGIEIPAGRRFFTLDLLNDLPVEKDKKFKDVLEQELFAGIDLKIEKAFPSVILRGGYDYREMREKPLQEKIGAGSTFLVSVPAGNEEKFRGKMNRMVEESINYEWDAMPLFMVNNPKHIKMWR